MASEKPRPLADHRVLKKIVHNSRYFLRQLFFPYKCLKCGAYLKSTDSESLPLNQCFCTICLGDGIHWIKSGFCTACGMKFASDAGSGHVCGNCLEKPLSLGKVRAALEYKGVIKDAIPLFKYSSKTTLLEVFEPLMFQTFLDFFSTDPIDIIHPIPLHRKKLMERGFNQACLLVRGLEKSYIRQFRRKPDWQLDITLFKRVKRTASQTGFDSVQRRRNLKDAFAVTLPEKVKNRHILLIDDVFTTGATCNEAARVLLRAGAKQVDALVLARA